MGWWGGEVRMKRKRNLGGGRGQRGKRGVKLKEGEGI